MELDLDPDELAELWAILDSDEDAHVAAADRDRKGKKRKRKRCVRTPLHPHCRSVKWARVYEALRRKGKSKKNSAQIANYMYNKWRTGRVKRKAFP